jgi:hypothetical protein
MISLEGEESEYVLSKVESKKLVNVNVNESKASLTKDGVFRRQE